MSIAKNRCIESPQRSGSNLINSLWAFRRRDPTYLSKIEIFQLIEARKLTHIYIYIYIMIYIYDVIVILYSTILYILRILHCIILYHIMLCYVILYCIILYYIITTPKLASGVDWSWHFFSAQLSCWILKSLPCESSHVRYSRLQQ